VFAFSEEVVPDQKYRTKFAAMASALVKVVPVPWMSVLTASLVPGFAFGMLTVGALPNDPVAVTAELAPTEDEEEEEGEDEEEDFDEPQPARTTQASRGMALSARKRRMKTLKSGGCQLRQPTGTAERLRPAFRRRSANSRWLTDTKMAAPRRPEVAALAVRFRHFSDLYLLLRCEY